jgi:hypothetical protein
LYQPKMIGDGDCGYIGGMKIGRGNWSTRRKPTPMPLCPLQIRITWLSPGLYPGRRGGKPATNRLSYGAAQRCFRKSIRMFHCLISAELFVKQSWPNDIIRRSKT